MSIHSMSDMVDMGRSGQPLDPCQASGRTSAVTAETEAAARRAVGAVLEVRQQRADGRHNAACPSGRAVTVTLNRKDMI